MAEMFITPIQLMDPLDQTTAKSEAGKAAQDVISSFKGIFENAINDVKTTDDTLAKAQYLLATGQTEDPHSVTIAASEAQLAVDMLVALRSKALEAYNEIMRISS
jgi:flagellar hook-basal body complex protein FliE